MWLNVECVVWLLWKFLDLVNVFELFNFSCYLGKKCEDMYCEK